MQGAPGDPGDERERLEASSGRFPFLPEHFGVGRLFWRIRDAVIVANAKTERIVLWNPAAAAIFGYSAGEALQLPLHSLVPDSLKPRHRAGLARYQQTGHGSLIDRDVPVELPALHRDGHPIQIELSLTPLEQLEEDDSRYVLALVRDVTERKRLEAFRDRFIANAAHELRNPVTALSGLGKLLETRRDSMTDQEQEAAIHAVAREGERVAKLVRDLLDLSRLEQGRLEPHLEDLPLAALVGSTVEANPPPLGKSVDVAIPKSVIVRADPDFLQQVLVNLLSNAYMYGGRRIRCETELSGQSVLLIVADDGPGVPDPLGPVMFEPFTRGDERRAGGAGLGLAIVRMMLEAMKGKISYEQGVPPGARFRLTLCKGDQTQS